MKKHLSFRTAIGRTALGLLLALAVALGGLASQHPWNTRAVGADHPAPAHLALALQQQPSKCNGTTLSSSELYNPATGTWFAGPDLGVPREQATLTPLGDADGRLLLAGGFCYTGSTTSGVSPSATIYDPVTNSWSQTGYMVAPGADQGSVLLPNGEVLVAGGIDANGVPTNTAQLYNPATGTWSSTGAMQVPRVNPSLFLLTTGPNQGDVLAVGGITPPAGSESFFTNITELYNPSTGEWGAAASLPNDYPETDNVGYFGGVTLTNGDIFLAGGANAHGEGDLDNLYDPTLNKWISHTRNVAPRMGGGAVALANGNVLAFGGISSSFCSSEVLNTSTFKWSMVPNPMIDCGLMGMSTQLLPNGQVLVAGGWAAAGSANAPQGGMTADCELFDPTAQTWTATGSLSTPRRFAMSAVLTTGPNAGDVFIVGGDSGNQPLPTPPA